MQQAGAHMNSKRLRKHAQSLHGCAPERVLEWKGEANAPPLRQKISPTDSHLQRKNSFPWRNKPLLRGGTLLRRRWPTHNELYGIFEGSLSHKVKSQCFCFLLLFFFPTLEVVCLHMMTSGFVFPWDFCECECVYVHFLCFFLFSCLVILSYSNLSDFVLSYFIAIL